MCHVFLGIFWWFFFNKFSYLRLWIQILQTENEKKYFYVVKIMPQVWFFDFFEEFLDEFFFKKLCQYLRLWIKRRRSWKKCKGKKREVHFICIALTTLHAEKKNLFWNFFLFWCLPVVKIRRRYYYFLSCFHNVSYLRLGGFFPFFSIFFHFFQNFL